VVYPGFYKEGQSADDLPEGITLPDTYVLLPEAMQGMDLNRLVDVWSWVHGSVGEYYPLLLAGLSDSQRKGVEAWFSKNEMKDWVQVLPPLSPIALPTLYERSTVVFHMGSFSAWGNSARNALAAAKPFVATLSAEMDAIVGPAAFLTPVGEERSLGAALVSVIVEESLSEQLSEAARQRSSGWDAGKFSAALRQAYIDILSR
jgi:glycosyltransferase involved in cell wall biosynthesis